MAQVDFSAIIFNALERFTASSLAAQTSILDKYGLQRSKLRQRIGESQPVVTVKVGSVEYTYSLPEYHIYPDLGVQGTEKSLPGAASSPFKYKNLNVSRQMLKSIKEWIAQTGHVNIYSQDKEQAKLIKSRVMKIKDKRLKTKTRDKMMNKAAFAVAIGVKKRGIKRTGFVADTFTPKRFQELANDIMKETGQQVMISITDKFKK